ncbi:hypothetical protein [Nocardia sp. NPDC057455]|uniref:hypothetical protein n=1 Tax=Nocardia sp. NPDC057455 TaxID=3346138 RepID=UPI003670BF6E
MAGTLRRAGLSSVHRTVVPAPRNDEQVDLQRTPVNDVPESSVEPSAGSDRTPANPADEPPTTSPPASGLTTMQSALPASAGSAATATAGMSPTDIDGLVDRLYEPIVRKLKAELRLARERAGTALDLTL